MLLLLLALLLLLLALGLLLLLLLALGLGLGVQLDLRLDARMCSCLTLHHPSSTPISPRFRPNPPAQVLQEVPGLEALLCNFIPFLPQFRSNSPPQVLQEVPGLEAPPRAPLLHDGVLRAQDGPLLVCGWGGGWVGGCGWGECGVEGVSHYWRWKS